MRNLKKVLSLALALVMLVGMMVIGAGATTYKDDDSIKNKEAVAVMSALKILEGDTKTNKFNPKNTLTRAEAAKIITYMVLGADTAKNFKATTNQFSDVSAKAWYAPYVAFCYEYGIVEGTSKTKFSPDGLLTDYAFAKMVLVAMGKSADESGYNGGTGWKVKVAKDAQELGLIDMLGKPLTGAKMTRDDAVQLAFAGMITPVSGKTTVYAVTVGSTTYEFDSMMEAAIYASLNSSAPGGVTGPTAKVKTTGSLADKQYTLTSVDTTDAYGNPTKTWTTGDDAKKLVVMDAAAPAITIKGEDFTAKTLEGYTKATGFECWYNGKKIYDKIANEGGDTPENEWYTNMYGKCGVTVKVYASGTSMSKVVVTEPYYAEVKDIASNGDVTLSVYEAGQVLGKWNTGTVGAKPTDFVVHTTDTKGYALVKSMAEGDKFIGIFGSDWEKQAADTLTGEGKTVTGDWLLSVDNPTTATGKATASQIKAGGGADEKSYGGSTIAINGVTYKFANEYSRTTVDLGSEGTFYLYNGYVMHFVGKTEETGAPQYAVALAFGKKDGTGSSTDLTATTTAAVYQAKLFKTDGTVDVVEISKVDNTAMNDAKYNDIKTTSTGLIGKFVSYNLVDGKYELTTVATDAEDADKLTVVPKGSITAVASKTPAIATGVVGNNATVFLMDLGDDADGWKQTTATGIANAPSINSVGTSKGTLAATDSFAAIVVNGIAKYVYVKADKVDGAAQSDAKYAYIKNSVTPSKSYAADGKTQIVTVDAFIDGAWTTLSATNTNAAFVTSKDGLVTYKTTDGYVSEMVDVKDGAALRLASGGVMLYGITDTAQYNEKTVIYQASADGSVKTLTVGELEAIDVTKALVEVGNVSGGVATLIWVLPKPAV